MEGRIRRRASRAALELRARFGSQRAAVPPPAAFERDLDEPFADYWRRRLDHSEGDSWAGVTIMKAPEDLRVYQHLLWSSRADTVVEAGAKWGGSLLWFRDQLRTFASYGRLARAPTVIGADLSTSQTETVLDREHPDWREQISLIEGDVREPAVARRIIEAVPDGARCLVVEDAAHTGEVTRAALDALAPLVPPGGFYVVEDGHVDIERLHPGGPPRMSQLGVDAGGVQRAIEEWLQTPGGSEFSRRADLELYGVTSNPGGYLQRREGE